MISKEEQCDNLIFVTVSDIGSNHRILCIPNQDAADFRFDGEDFVLAVSDGVGSCKEAERGSKYAVEACLKLFDGIKSHVLHFDNTEIVEAIIAEWKLLIGRENADEFCATLKAVVKIGNDIKLVSIGDGIAAVTSNGIKLLAPTEDMSFTNETKCLRSQIKPESFWIGDFRIDTYEPFAVFCCTDGVANGLTSGKELELVEEIEKNTLNEELKFELETLVNEIGEYNFDDKTVGVVKYERKN